MGQSGKISAFFFKPWEGEYNLGSYSMSPRSFRDTKDGLRKIARGSALGLGFRFEGFDVKEGQLLCNISAWSQPYPAFWQHNSGILPGCLGSTITFDTGDLTCCPICLAILSYAAQPSALQTNVNSGFRLSFAVVRPSCRQTTLFPLILFVQSLEPKP